MRTIKRRRTVKPASDKSAAEIIAEIRGGNQARAESYRERSLRLHGLICAKCGREFTDQTRHLLTVHHKDGNPNNNPPEGSNWENLCRDCHEDEHSRGLLGQYLHGR